MQIFTSYLGGPVGLGHLTSGGDGVSEDFSIIGNPGPADALCLFHRKNRNLIRIKLTNISIFLYKSILVLREKEKE